MKHRRKKTQAGKARRANGATGKAATLSVGEKAQAAVNKIVSEQLADGIGDTSFAPEDRHHWRIVREAVCSSDDVPNSVPPSEAAADPTFELHQAMRRQFAEWKRLRGFLEQLFKTMLPGVLWSATIPTATLEQLVEQLAPKKMPDSSQARQDFAIIARAINNDHCLRNALLILSHHDRPKLFVALKELLTYLSKRACDPHLCERDFLLLKATAIIDRETKTPHPLRLASRKRLVQETLQKLNCPIPDLDSRQFHAVETRLHRVLSTANLRKPAPLKKSVK